MQRISISTFVSVLLALATSAGLGCDPCAVFIAGEARRAGQIGWYAGVSEQFTSFSTLQIDGHEVANPANQYLDSSITQLFAGYGITDRLSMQINLPIIARSFRHIEGGEPRNDSVAGIGDLSLVANYRLVEIKRDSFRFIGAVQAGIKLPTGDSSRLKAGDTGHGEAPDHHAAKTRRHGEEVHPPEPTEEHVEPEAPANAIHGHDVALGSGSVDGLLGATFHLSYDRCFIDGAVQYAIRSTGSYDYRYANDLRWETGPGVYLLEENGSTLAAQLVASGEVKGADDADGTSEDNATTTFFLGPALLATWQDRLSGRLGVDVPIVVENEALQAVPDFRIRASISWNF